MRKTVVAVSSAVAMLAVPLAASAGDFYVAGSVGQSDIGLDRQKIQGGLDGILINKGATALSSSSSLSNTDTGYKLQLGYRFNENFAVEGGYVDLGKAKYSQSSTATQGTASAAGNVAVDGLVVSAVGILPVAKDVDLFGKLGMFVGQAKASLPWSATLTGGASGSGQLGGTKSQAVPTYGIGASYAVNKQVSVRAEYEWFNLQGIALTGNPTATLFSVGAVYKF